jgi:AcrR family transcriptional regulator
MSTEIIKSSEDALTRGHKKKARTRQQLIDAALRIYARKGASDLALNELAEEGGVSNGTVYNYFRTKEEVLEAVGLALAEQYSLRVLAASEGIVKGAERLAIGVRMFIRHALNNHQWASALINVIHYAEGMRSAHAAYVRNDLQIGFEQGDLNYTDVNVAMGLVVAVTVSAMTNIVEGRSIEGHDSVIAEMILLALGASADQAKHIAYLSMPQASKLE